MQESNGENTGVLIWREYRSFDMATIIEIMETANRSPISIMQHKDNKYLRAFLTVGFIPQYKMILPETDPPYTPNPMEEAQVSSGIFWQFCNKLEIFVKKYDKIGTIKIENAFIQALETMSAKEAKLVLAAKNQRIPSLYKKVTLEALKKVGFFVI